MFAAPSVQIKIQFEVFRYLLEKYSGNNFVAVQTEFESQANDGVYAWLQDPSTARICL
jgi:hypothetical protein